MSKHIENNAYAGIALIAALMLMFWSVYLPPIGIIDGSVLYGTGQCLLYSATMAGFGATALKIIKVVNELKELRNGDTKRTQEQQSMQHPQVSRQVEGHESTAD